MLLRLVREGINVLLPVASVGGDVVGGRLLTFWGATGALGPRGVQFEGAWNSATVYQLADIVIDDDGADNPATWIALAANTNKKPRDNPSDWAYFPGSFPETVNDGLWSDTIIQSTNDGVWGV